MTDALVSYEPLHAAAVLDGRRMRAPTTSTYSTCGYLEPAWTLSSGGLKAALVVPGHASNCRVFYSHAADLRDLVVHTLQMGRRPPSFAFMEKVQRDLERLKDGWNGEGSLAPSEAVLADFQRFVGVLPILIGAPDVEVDEDTGHVALRWSSKRAGISFVLRGTGQALCVKTTMGQPARVTSRSFDLAMEGPAVARYLADPDLADALQAA